MKYKFWTIYIAIVTLFAGIGYFALADVSDIPLALSESDMATLRGAVGSDERCIIKSEPGCTDSNCHTTPRTLATYGYYFNDCQSYSRWYCNYWGPSTGSKAQTMCRTVYYNQDCSDYIWETHDENGNPLKRPRIKVKLDQMADCNSRLIRKRN